MLICKGYLNHYRKIKNLAEKDLMKMGKVYINKIEYQGKQQEDKQAIRKHWKKAEKK